MRALPMQAALQGVLRRHVGVRLVELDAQRGARRVAGRAVAACLAHRRGAGGHRRCRSSSARCSRAETDAAWPLLDSLTTWFSLLATWLAARAKLENWLYWIAIDGVLVFLFYVQGLPFLALLNRACSSASRRPASSPGAASSTRADGARMIDGALLQHVPGCEDGEAPYSQELIGGGKVNRSFLVRTRRGRFVVRLNENATTDPGLDRDRELALHTAAAKRRPRAARHLRGSRTAPASSPTIVDGRLWTPHYFTRMRDLRSLGPAPAHVCTRSRRRRWRASTRCGRAPLRRSHRARRAGRSGGRIQFLLASGAEALARSGSAQRPPAIVHSDLHHGNVLTADRVYFIDWEYAQVGDPLLDLACVMAYYPRAVPHGALLLEASGLADARRHVRHARSSSPTYSRC